MSALVHRFTPSPFGRHGRIELDIDARQARLQYRRARRGDRHGLTPGRPANRQEARMVVVYTFCKAVTS